MLFISDNALLMTRHMEKFHDVISLDPKVIGANKLHFKPIFNPPLKKLLGEPPSPVGYGLARLGHSVARVKISGRSTSGRNMVFRKKSIFGV